MVLPTTLVRLALQRYWRLSRGLLLSTSAVVSDADGRVLLCREASEASEAANTSAPWRLPGGEVLKGEDVRGALQRILATGGLATAPEHAHVFAIYADPSRSRADHVTLLTLRLDAPGTDRRRGLLEWRWFAIADLPAVMDAPSRRRIDEIRGLRPISQVW